MSYVAQTQERARRNERSLSYMYASLQSETRTERTLQGKKK